ELPGGIGVSTVGGSIGWRGYGGARAGGRDWTGARGSGACGVGAGAGATGAVLPRWVGFLGGFVRWSTRRRIHSALHRSRSARLPVVSLIATGGSRMQEGMRALVQLQRLARAAALTRQAGLPQIAVLYGPTTGGGWATLGAGADVVLALPEVQVGFAGSRVRPPGDPHAYTAEAHVEAGQVDQIVDRPRLRETLGRW